MSKNTNSGSGFSLKDELFNREKVKWLATFFKRADKTFNDKNFVKDVMKDISNLELKERIVLIAKVLENHLSLDFEVAAQQIEAALPPALDPDKTDDDFGDFIIAPLGHFVVRNGVSKKHLKTSLSLLKELTKRFSMEDAIRYFINKFPEETLVELGKWTTDKNYHVRRLVSEGTRPLLPWSGRIQLNQSETIPLLNALHTDETRYVTRSVANHLNDVAKINPPLVIQTLKEWHSEQRQDKKELDWMARHSLRTLVKQGNKEALCLLGYRSTPKISVGNIHLSKKKLKVGETLEFSSEITALADENLMIDYVVDFVKANGKKKPKVHKLKQVALNKGESIHINKRHKLNKNATTVAYYPGNHTITLQINGKLYSSVDFDLAT